MTRNNPTQPAAAEAETSLDMTDDLETRLNRVLVELEDQADTERQKAYDPYVSRTMQQAHLHRATARTGTIRKIRTELGL